MPSDHAALVYATESQAALCTIVGIDGSFSRRCGAQLAVGQDGTMIGDMADNCLRNELATQAATAARDGNAKLLRYGKGSPFIDFRLPCGSGLDILIDPAPQMQQLSKCVADLAERRASSLPLAVPVAADRRLLRVRHYVPRLRLLVLGAGAECEALLRQAKAMGVEIELRTAGQQFALNMVPAGISADPWTAVLLIFHDHEWEHSLLAWALRTPAFYIGCQGGSQARARRLELLRADGWDDSALARINSPVGLIPSARSHEVLALSILSEVVGAYEALHPHP
jgi:xanthine dehydrogenase accessory factor